MKRWFVALACLLAACGRAPSGGVGQSKELVAAAAEVSQSAAQCGDPGSNLVDHFASSSDLQARLVGVWVRCDGPAISPAQDEAGIAVRPDGTWSALRQKSDGSLVWGSGFDYEGSWEIVDTSAMNGAGVFQVTWHRTQSFLPTLVAFTESPVKVRLRSMAGDATYVRVNVPVVSPGDGPQTRTCADPGQNVQTHFASADALKALLVGQWLRCTGNGPITQDSGIEFDPDGRWFGLQSADTDALRHLSGSGHEGTWELVDTSAMNGAGTYQVNVSSGDGWLGCFPALTTRPTKLQLSCMGGTSTFILHGETP